MTNRTPEHDRCRDRRPHNAMRYQKAFGDDETRDSGKLRRRSRGEEGRFDWRRSLDTDLYDDD